MSTTGSDLTNLDDPSAHYGLDHAATVAPASRPRKTSAQIMAERAARTGMPIDAQGRPTVKLPDQSIDVDPELVGKSPEAIAEILEYRASHREGCADPGCGRCNAVNDALLRGEHVTTGGGSGGGRRRRKAGGGRNTDAAMAHVYEDEIERDRRPVVVSGRVSIEANTGLCGDDVPNPGEILNAIGLALYRGVAWENIVAAVTKL